MAKGKLLNLFNNDLEEDVGYSHITKEVKKNKKVKISTESSTILEPSKHFLFTQKEKRRAKIVTIVGHFELADKEKKELLTELRKKLGCGGTLKGNLLEFQGDIAKRVREELVKKGFRFKK